MQVSASDHCERTILFTALCFNLAKDQINEGEKAWVWQKPQTLCWDEPYSCWCSCDKASRNPVATWNHVAEHWTFAVLTERTLGHSCRNPVHVHHQYRWKGTHVEPISPHLPFLQRVRSMKSVSFAMVQVDKAWVWQTPQTFCQEDSLVADAVFWRLSGIPALPGITCITLPVPVPSKNVPRIEQILPCWKIEQI